MPTAPCDRAGFGPERPAARHRRARAVVADDQVGDQPPVPGPVLTEQDGRLADRGMPGQRGLDLAELDAEPPQLHLVVEPPQELERSVGAPADPIAGPVEPLVGHEIHDESLGR